MSEPENYVKKEEPRVSIKQRRKKSIGGSYCCSTCGDSDRNHCTAYAGRSSLPDRIIRDWNCLLPA